jgi:hypothetical protein
MVPFDRFTVVLDACTMFPMLVRDVLLTLAAHEFFNPKWSPRIREEWMRNLLARMTERDGEAVAQSRIDRIAAAVDAAFPDALVTADLSEPATLEPVDAKDRHVVLTAIAAQADAIITFNLADFAVPHLSERLRIEVIHPDEPGRSQRETRCCRFSRAESTQKEPTLGDGRTHSSVTGGRSCANLWLAK